MRLARRHTCVVDLNLQSGDQPLYLGVTPNYSFTDVVRNFERLDDQLLASYLTPRSKGLSLLAAPTDMGRDQEVRDDHVMRSLGLLRTLTDFIVLDVPRSFDDLTVQALDTAEEKILLLTQDVPAIRSAKRTLDMFARLGYDRTRVKVVVNRFERKPEFVLREESIKAVTTDHANGIECVGLGVVRQQYCGKWL